MYIVKISLKHVFEDTKYKLIPMVLCKKLALSVCVQIRINAELEYKFIDHYNMITHYVQ